MIAFFTYASLYKPALPHWSALFYMLFIPLGTYYMIHISKNYLKFAIGFGLIISVISYAELGFKFIPQPEYKSLHRDIYGWDKIMSKANEQITDASTQALGITNWTLASRAIYYNRNYNSNVYLIDARDDQFDVWEKEKPLGKDIVIINTHAFKKDIDAYMKCSEVIIHDEFDIMLNNSKVNTVQLVTCKNYQGLK